MSAENLSGLLYIHIHSINGFKDPNLIGRADPFVSVSIGEKSDMEQKTRVIKDGSGEQFALFRAV